MVISAADPLTRVCWIGGGSGSGKSTIAERLATSHELALYRTDDEMRTHAPTLSSTEAPLLHRFLAMDMDERWVSRSPREMLDTFHWFHGEGFDRLLDDVRALAAEGAVMVEGFHLLPRLVAPLLADRHRAVWLLPTPEWRMNVLRARLDSGLHFVDRTSNPERALANLAERDHLFTEVVRAEVRALSLASMDVDGSLGVDDLAARIAEQFRMTPRS